MSEHSTAVTTTDHSRNLPIHSMADANQLAVSLAQAKVLGAGNPAEGMLAVILIKEVGLVKASATYHLMFGQLSKKATAILAHFTEKGGTYRIVRRDSECAEVIASFGDTKDMTFSFSWEEAKQEPFVYDGKPGVQIAQLSKPFEQRKLKAKYATPRSRMQMLWARLVSDFGNALCPDACEGLYPPEVVSDFSELDDRKESATAGQVIDIAEAQRRTDASIVQDFQVCPIGGEGWKGKKWEDFPSASLMMAMASDDPAISDTHRAAIQVALDNKRAAEGGA